MEQQHNAKQNRKNILKFSIISILVISAYLYAEKSEYTGKTLKPSWSILFENDFFAQNGDRYYTHGTQISCIAPGEGPKLIETFSKLCPFFIKYGEQTINYKLGQVIFTPENTDAVTLCKDDRPYAGYLFASTALISKIKVNETMDSGNILELTLGILGPASRAKETQIWFHKQIGNKVPRGWDNQLHNEFGIGISYSRIWALTHIIFMGLEINVAPQMSCMIGNIYTYGGGGAISRFGKNVRCELSPPNIHPSFPGFPSLGDNCLKSWYFFIGSENRLMIRNIFLDGNTFQDSHRVNKECIVVDFQFGFAFHFGNIKFAVSNMIRSREFEGQSRLTRYGSISISWQY